MDYIANKNINRPKSFREKAASFFTSHFFILETILISTFIMAWIGGPGYLVGFIAALVTLWATRWDWSYFGIGKIMWTGSILPALGYVILIILFNDFLLEPIIEIITGEGVKLTVFESLHGNLTNLLMMLAIMWVMVAFGEEFFFRGMT